MLERVLVEGCVAGAAPWWAQEDGVKALLLLLRKLELWYLQGALVVLQLQEVSMDELHLVWLLQGVHLRVVPCVLNLLWVHVRGHAEAALPGELDEVPADAAEGVEDVGLPLVVRGP